MSGKKIWIAALLACLLACGKSHGDASSGSNWLKCQTLVDCSGASEALTCSSGGFCEDAEGERIASIEAREPAPERAATPRCAWGVDALLKEVPASAPDRKNCGSFAGGDSRLKDGMSCFEQARAAGSAVQISLNRCIDCAIPTTYVATAAGDLYALLMEDDAFGDPNRTAKVEACGSVGLDSMGSDIVCQNPRQLYECSELRTLPIIPYKLTDLTVTPGGESTVFHLYVSNQSFETPRVAITVQIDGVGVVHGDFDVGGQHTWLLFELRMPPGKHRVSAYARGGFEMLEEREVDVSAKPWGVLDFWNEAQPLRLETYAMQPVFG